jgi:hypothetical protein
VHSKSFTLSEHFENYELTQLRRIFLGQKGLLQPGGIDIYQVIQRQRDFDLAAANCGDSFIIRRICDWLKDVDSGVKNFQLEERIDKPSM